MDTVLTVSGPFTALVFLLVSWWRSRNDSISVLDTALKTALNSVITLQKRADSLEAEIHRIRDHHTETVSKLQNEIVELRANIAAQAVLIEQQGKRIEELASEVVDKNTEIATLKEKLLGATSDSGQGG